MGRGEEGGGRIQAKEGHEWLVKARANVSGEIGKNAVSIHPVTRTESSSVLEPGSLRRAN